MDVSVCVFVCGETALDRVSEKKTKRIAKDLLSQKFFLKKFCFILFLFLVYTLNSFNSQFMTLWGAQQVRVLWSLFSFPKSQNSRAQSPTIRRQTDRDSTQAWWVRENRKKFLASVERRQWGGKGGYEVKAQMVELKEGMGRNGRKETDTPVSWELPSWELIYGGLYVSFKADFVLLCNGVQEKCLSLMILSTITAQKYQTQHTTFLSTT